jgi:RNA polymerase sigma-70 factor (ECF subfamily)
LRALEIGADEKLLIEAAQRDPARFSELYERNFGRVYAFIAHRVGDREEAQDLTSEVFHEALAGIGRFEWRGAPFIAWLLGIASNRLARRWQRITGQQEVPMIEDFDFAGADGQIEQRAMLFQLVEELPPDQRQVIISRFVHQRSLREIAQELQRSEGAVKQLQLRALQNLRTQMNRKKE